MSEACPNGALKGICSGWARCPVCGPDMWLSIWSRGHDESPAQPSDED